MTGERTADQTGGATVTVAGGDVLVLTGTTGSGKSTCCRTLAQAARAAGLRVHGLTTTVEVADGGAERWVEDLNGGERRLLGRPTSPEAIAAGSPRWQLSDAALAWSDVILRAACPTDLLIIDEVGPVELLHRRGVLAGVEHAMTGPYRLAVVVVRPWLVPRFRQLFPTPPAELVDVVDTATLEARLAGLVAAHQADAAGAGQKPVQTVGATS
jgi:nucleoside-triphosphatase THEP1